MPFTVAHKPTKKQRDTVKTLYGAGVSQLDISRHIGIGLSTLLKHYREELSSGSMTLGVTALTRLAKDMNNPKSGMSGTTAAIWVTKNTRGLNWADKVDKTGDGATVQIGDGAKVIILPSNGMEQIVQQKLLGNRPVIEAEP